MYTLYSFNKNILLNQKKKPIQFSIFNHLIMQGLTEEASFKAALTLNIGSPCGEKGTYITKVLRYAF